MGKGGAHPRRIESCPLCGREISNHVADHLPECPNDPTSGITGGTDTTEE